MDQKRKILRDFTGEMSESVKVTRWGVPVSNNEDNSQNFFMQYAGGHTLTQNQTLTNNQNLQNAQIVEQPLKPNSRLNEVGGIESGFRKFKNNQALTLKELKQQYEILKSLPVDERVPLSPKRPDSDNSSIRDDQSQSSSKHSKGKRESGSREAQLLALEKKQLEVVIGNSMRKIEQLLHNEMNYKKQIHELKLQLDDKSPQEKYQNIIRTLKKNEADANDTIQSLKREIDRQKGVNKQQSDTIGRLQSEIMAKNQELIKTAEERRKFDDVIRFEKDKYSNLEIDIRRIKMEQQMFQKDKTNEIGRLNKQLEQKDALFEREWSIKVRRLEEELQTRENRYNLLLDQFEQMKKNTVPVEKLKEEKPEPKPTDTVEDLRKVLVETLAVSGRDNNNYQLKELLDKMEDLKEQNRELRGELRTLHEQNLAQDPRKSQMLVDTISAMFNKIDNSNKSTDQTLKKEIQVLKNQVETMHQRPDTLDKIKQQDQIIKELQKLIEDENLQKKKFIQEMQMAHEEYDQLVSAHEKHKMRMNDLLEKQKAYKQQISELRRQVETLKQDIEILQSAKGSFTNSQNQLIELRLKAHHFEAMEVDNKRLHEEIAQMRTLNKRKEDQYENEIRSLKRKLDQLQFQTDKIQKQKSFDMDMEKSTHMTEINRVRAELDQSKNEKSHFIQELEKMKAFYENRLVEKNNEIQNTRVQFEERLVVKENEHETVRIQYQEKHQSKVGDIETLVKNLEDQIKFKSEDYQVQKNNYENLLRQQRQSNDAFIRSLNEKHEAQLLNSRERSELTAQALRDKHQQELSVILKRLEVLSDANQKFMIQNQRYLDMERELFELRKIVRHAKSMNDGVDHLWQIKQTEYNNVHEILKHMKLQHQQRAN